MCNLKREPYFQEITIPHPSISGVCLCLNDEMIGVNYQIHGSKNKIK